MTGTLQQCSYVLTHDPINILKPELSFAKGGHYRRSDRRLLIRRSGRQCAIQLPNPVVERQDLSLLVGIERPYPSCKVGR